MQCDLTGRVAIVTGGGGAIGAAIARRLAANGARLVIADIDEEAARGVAAELPDAIAVATDITDHASVANALAATMDAFGRLDILVNNAGVNSVKHRVTLDDYPADEWSRIIGIDLDGLFRMTGPTVDLLGRNSSGGRIINIGSVVGVAAMRLQAPFAAAKAAVAHLTRVMALEFGPRGIVTNAIAPGSIVSAVTRQLFYDDDGSFVEKAKEFMTHIPSGRPGQPEEIGEVALFLASEEAGYINGQVLCVDGGWTAGYSAIGAS